jgi:hypothetical protein
MAFVFTVATRVATAPTVSSAWAMRPCIGDESAGFVVSGPLVRVVPGLVVGRGGFTLASGVALGLRLVVFRLFHGLDSTITSKCFDLQLFHVFDGKALMSREAEAEKRHSARENKSFPRAEIDVCPPPCPRLNSSTLCIKQTISGT